MLNNEFNLNSEIMSEFRLLNCHIYLYITGILTSDTFVVYTTFWVLFDSLLSQFFDYIEAS